jgi:hypothetical protein
LNPSPDNSSGIIIDNKSKTYIMASNKPTGDSSRKGAVKKRSQLENPLTGTMTKRDKKSGQFMDVKSTEGKFKGVRKEK